MINMNMLQLVYDSIFLSGPFFYDWQRREARPRREMAVRIKVNRSIFVILANQETGLVW